LHAKRTRIMSHATRHSYSYINIPPIQQNLAHYAAFLQQRGIMIGWIMLPAKGVYMHVRDEAKRHVCMPGPGKYIRIFAASHLRTLLLVHICRLWLGLSWVSSKSKQGTSGCGRKRHRRWVFALDSLITMRRWLRTGVDAKRVARTHRGKRVCISVRKGPLPVYALSDLIFGVADVGCWCWF
jgi:hypothetical protein